MNKPKDLYHPFFKKILKKILPNRIYRCYVGRHDDESIRLWKMMAKNIPPEEAILDIGAFEGIYALAARECNSRAPIYAFEPNPETAEKLRARCVSKNIATIETALAETNGAVSFLLNSQMSRILDSSPLTTERATQVKAMTLDTWISQNSVNPSLIKIDTEGAEGGIFRGGQNTLRSHRPIIICEVLNDLAGKEVALALPKNYVYYYIEENTGIFELPKITRKAWRNTNWLLVPKERISEVKPKH